VTHFADTPDTRTKFEKAPVHDGVVPTYRAAFARIEYQLKVIKTVLSDPSLKISATIPYEQSERQARIRFITADPFE
jgi:hypothetical protein